MGLSSSRNFSFNYKCRNWTSIALLVANSENIKQSNTHIFSRSEIHIIFTISQSGQERKFSFQTIQHLYRNVWYRHFSGQVYLGGHLYIGEKSDYTLSVFVCHKTSSQT